MRLAGLQESGTLEQENLPASIAGSSRPVLGMTTRIARGSLWGLGGQIATLAASLIATPFVIRLLGTEAYGVLTLINVLIGTIAVADLGMGIASTKFAAEAHARSDEEGEVAAVWMSLLVLSVPALMAALMLAVMARSLVEHTLRLPAHLHHEAIWALRVAALGFVARSLGGVLNTPQLVRLRLDLYTAITSGGAVLQICLIPIALFLGGGLLTAIAVVVSVGVATACIHAAVSWRLLPCLLRPRARFELLGPLVRFGGATAVMTLAGVVLMNAEKLLTVRLASVTALAYYSVAFTLARLLALLPAALGQPLLPAFACLHGAPDREALQTLYIRALQGLFIGMVPAALMLCVGGNSWLSVWAGPEYGRESALPLYILIVGCLFDGMSYVPRILLGAVGRPDLIARYQLANLIPYILVAAGLILRLGVTGAAAAWSLRAIVEGCLMFRAARHTLGLQHFVLPTSRRHYGTALATLLLPVLLLGSIWPSSIVMTSVCLASLTAYSALIWMRVLTREERIWVDSLLRSRRLIGDSSA